MMIQRPANYDELTTSARAIVEDHIRAGVQPPALQPAREQVVTSVSDSEIDDD